LDQEQWTYTASIDLTIEPPLGHKTLDQSVTAGETGLLTNVEFYADVTSDRVYFYVNQSGRGGPPLENMTFVTQLQQGSGEYDIDVSPANIFLRAGDVFSIGLVGLEGTTPAGSFRAARDMNPDAYPRGALYWRYGGTGWLPLGYDDDMMFRTYVSPTSGPAQNLLQNPSFDSDGAGWTEGGWVDAVFRDDVGSPFAGGSGPGALEIFFYYRGGGSNGVFQEVPVTGGKTYSAALSVYMPSPDNPALAAPIGIGWYTASHGYIRGDYLYPDHLVRDQWMRISSHVAAPANAAFASFVAAITNPNDPNETRSSITFVDDAYFAPEEFDTTTQELFIPAAASAQGQEGTFWTTNGWLYNGSDDSADVYGAFLSQGRDNSAAIAAPTFLASIPAHGTAVLEDLVAKLGGSGTTGGLYLLGELDRLDGPLPFLYVTSQTSTPNAAGQGSYGQGIAAVAADTATRAIAPGACQSAEKRTNVGVLNTSSHPIALTITVFDVYSAVATSIGWTLAPYEQRQVGLSVLGVSSLSAGSVVFERTSAQGSFCGYLSIVDQDTGDAVYVAAR